MSFELFKPINKGVNEKDTYSIQAGKKKTGYYSGMIYFNGGMRDKLGLGNFKYVELYTDDKNMLIAVKFTNNKTEATRALRKNGNHYFITCTSWLYKATHELGYLEKGSGIYEISGDLVVLHPPVKDGLIEGTSNG